MGLGASEGISIPLVAGAAAGGVVLMIVVLVVVIVRGVFAVCIKEKEKEVKFTLYMTMISGGVGVLSMGDHFCG